MLVLRDGVGGEGKDKVCSEDSVFLGANGGGDEFLVVVVLEVFIEVVRGGAVAVDSFNAEGLVVGVEIGDLESLVVDVLGSDAVDVGVDGVDLGIGQVDVFRESVAGCGVGLVEGARGDGVRQIDPEEVIFPEYGIFVCLHPVGDIGCGRILVFVCCGIGRGVHFGVVRVGIGCELSFGFVRESFSCGLFFRVVSRDPFRRLVLRSLVVVVDSCVLIQDSIEVEFFECRDVAGGGCVGVCGSVGRVGGGSGRCVVCPVRGVCRSICCCLGCGVVCVCCGLVRCGCMRCIRKVFGCRVRTGGVCVRSFGCVFLVFKICRGFCGCSVCRICGCVVFRIRRGPGGGFVFCICGVFCVCDGLWVRVVLCECGVGCIREGRVGGRVDGVFRGCIGRCRPGMGGCVCAEEGGIILRTGFSA